MTHARESTEGFVGREHELAQLEAAQQRLVSIVGEPGIGKSRLAACFASRTGVHVVHASLAGTTTPEAIAVALAAALRLRDSSMLGRDVSDVVERVDAAIELRGAELILLDDAESAVEVLAPLVARWLELAPEARFLVTSRQALRLRAEHVIELGPLAAPSGDSLEQVRASDAARLLLASAPHLALDEGSAPEIARLVRCLDGNPLAIELAAARLYSLGLCDATERIAAGLDLLDRAPRDAAARHQSLRRAIDLSWELSSEAERALLARCSVIRGWFDVAAVEALAEGTIGDPLDALHGARERSLVSMREVAGRSRYLLSGPVRAYAQEVLEREGDADHARDRHAHWLADRAGRASLEWRRSARDEDLAFLREHQADLAAALERAEPETHARLLLAFDVLLAQRDRPEAHVAALRAPLAHPLPGELVCELRLALAAALDRAGDARSGLAELEAARVGASAELAARIEVSAGTLHQASGELDEAEAALRRALALAPRGESAVRALRGLGLVAHAKGALDEAEAFYRSARESASDHPLLDARLHTDLGGVRLAQHRLDEAREHFERALEQSERAPDPVTVGLTYGNLAILAQEQGDLDAAAAYFARAIDELGRAGHRLYEAHLGLYLGFLEHERGAPERAALGYERALIPLEAIGDRRMAGLALAGLGAAQAQRGRLAAARESFDRAARHLEDLGDDGLTLALELHRAHVLLTEADLAPTPEQARALREQVVSLTGASPERLARSDDARIALRILRARLAALTLHATRDGRVLRLPDGATIDLDRRDVLRRIMALLVSERASAPGQPCSISTSIGTARPGERMRWESANNRFKVALSTLRRLGLKDMIVRDEAGYMLDPAIAIAWLEPS